ncbi:DnaA N-terminal domain-containing protein [Bacillus tuaregi]|uniref:DnaA N-terminal domain-containing protein n=1 Tax=Bacillus tuaregi TaxID=1816695 RepID=UPI0008F8905F|nr:DnaA N-terminal domain-containing protein [Bacillus tuaregi]
MEWTVVLAKIAEVISKPAYETWFKNTEIEIKDDIVFVKAPNSFTKEWLEGRYKNLIFDSIREVAGRTYEIEIISSDEQTPSNHADFRYTSELTSYDKLKQLVEEQSELILQQQEKIGELEKRIDRLEQLQQNKL